MRIPLKALGIAASLAAMTALTPPATAQSFDEALALAYSNNPALRAQRASLRQTDEGVPQALSGYRPTVTLQGDATRSYSESSARAVGREDDYSSPYGLGLSVRQNLYDGSRTTARVDLAEASVKAARARLVAQEQDVLLAAVTAYVTVLRDEAILQLNISNEQVLRRQLEATKDRFEVGELTRTDVSQAEARYAGAQGDRSTAEGNLRASRAQFTNVIGVPPEVLANPTNVGTLPPSLDDAINQALENHPDSIAADFDEQAAEKGVDVTRGALLPSVDLQGNLSRDWNSVGSGTQVEQASIAAVVTVPLYQAGNVYSQVRESKQQVLQVRLSRDAVRRNIVETATRAWEALDIANARIRAFRSQINAARVALDGVQREAQVGSRTVLDVLDAEQELLDAKVSLVGAERDRLVAAFQLRESVGTLTARDLALPTPLYDPTENYRRVRDKWFGGDVENYDPAPGPN
ncbi:MAG: TolC family outer membrane protein [Magnetospiraceae bacterium]